MIPAPGGPEPMGLVAFSPDDASPSRARLGRVAAMIADAERSTPTNGSRDGREQEGVVVPMLPRRPRSTLPRSRTGTAYVRVSRSAVLADIGTAVRST